MAGAEKKGGEQEWQEQALDLLHFPPLMIHVALVLIAGWIASRWTTNLLFVFTLGFAYLCYIENRQRWKIETRIRSDERKSTDRKRLLSDTETARWLNNVVESVWPVFLEKFASEHFLMRLAPWFLEKYKPWTAKKVVLQQLYLGRSPPVFTFFRAGRHPTDGDHLVLEMTMNFSAAKDMRASMGVQMKKRVGLGIWTTVHISDIQVEGKLKVGVRFVKGWPVIGRLRICFSEAPILRMVAKPVTSYGVDVTDLPGIAAWLDKMIIDVLEQSLVEPNLLVVDVGKFVGDLMSVQAKLEQTKKASHPDGKTGGNWFVVGKKSAVATVVVEILEAEKLKPCDPNGKADPYVKIVLGHTHILTSIKRKTLYPIWHEQFRLPISSWDLPNMLELWVRDKDRFSDDEMGHKQIAIDDINDGQRHEMWVPLEGVKTGRLRVAFTVEATAPVDDKEKIACDNSQLEDVRKDSIASSLTVAGAESNREGSELAKIGSEGEALGSDSDETPMKSECQIVDVGYGQSGCVSIVNPGRYMVKEPNSIEKLRQRKKSGKGISERERQPAFEGEELANVQPDSAKLTAISEIKKSRMRKLLGRRQGSKGNKDVLDEDVSEELSEEAHEVVVVGNKGTEMHMMLDVDEEEIETIEDLNMHSETLVPESGELQKGNEDDVDMAGRSKSGRPSKRTMSKGTIQQAGKTVMKQAGKTAHNIGHVLKRFHSNSGEPDSPQSSLSRDMSGSFKQNETCFSGEVFSSEERGGGERNSLQSHSEVRDEHGLDLTNEAEKSWLL